MHILENSRPPVHPPWWRISADDIWLGDTICSWEQLKKKKCEKERRGMIEGKPEVKR
jgi:hypothetical protein